MNFEYKLARLAACLLLASAGVPAHAQLPLQAAAADPQASVPPTRYQSALDYRPPAAPATTPDRNWVASNATVAATNSMALTMKPMTGHAGHAAAGGDQDQAADPHAGHAMPGMQMTHDDSPAMCAPAGTGAGQGMQCKPGCCEHCPCMDKMKQHKETP